MSKDESNALETVAGPMGDARVAPAHAVASVALTLAMKYHDINTIQDGALYQQYKLEGKNITPLHLDMVFETAIKIERHLLASSDRIAQIVVDAVIDGASEEERNAENSSNEQNEDV